MSSLGFSYAQAAKGLAPSSNVSSNPASSASSEHGAKDTNVTADLSAAQSRLIRSQKNDKESVQPTLNQSSIAQQEGEASTQQQEKISPLLPETVAEDTKSTQSTPSSVDDSISSSRVVDSSLGVTAPPTEDTEDARKISLDSNDVQEKAREADDDWEKVSIPSNSAEKELKAAPIPVVNIWQQRREAQQAKLKEQPVQRSTTLSQPPTKSSPHQAPQDESKKRTVNRENSTSDATRVTPGKSTSNSRVSRDQQVTGTSPRSTSQQGEQTAIQSLPPVDAASWPTPESAVVDPGRRSSLLDKAEKIEAADVKSSNRKNQWTTLPFVPSVKFETQLPSSRRGGRPANTRGGGRGATTTQGEKTTERLEPGAMGPPPLPKVASEQDRGRKANPARVNRASSVPTESPRAEASGFHNEIVAAKDAVAGVSKSPTPFSQESAVGVEIPSSKELSRSSSRQAHADSAMANRLRTDANQALQGTDATDGTPRQSQRPDKYTHPSSDVSRPPTEVNEKTSKEWSKDRPSKGENWRTDQRGERPERGRGSYRGRGGRAGYNNPSFTTPLPQNGFDVPKNGSASDARPSRQSSQNYGTPSFSNNRSNTRAQSIPIGMLQGAYFTPAQSYPQTPAPIQTDVAYNHYSQMSNGMPAGIMSAIPYNEPLNGYALISMVSRQLEYYFSLDNLCKDMFLRKNMDSQGFVLLRVIADFRRIKTLLGEGSMSYEHLRGVAAHVPNTEFITGNDGVDRLRSRGNWKDFVLPMEERIAQAQNDGPDVTLIQPRPHVGIPPEFHMSNGLRSAPPNINGFQDAFANHHAPTHFSQGLVNEPPTNDQWSNQLEGTQSDDRRASVTSPLGKAQSPGEESRNMYTAMTNGHRDSMSSTTPGKENTFPDENIALLKVVVKDPEYQGHEESSVIDDPIPSRSSGLRGGAGSPEQFERIRGLQFGQNALTRKKSDEHTMYFTQGEGPRPDLMRPGYIHEDYVTLRDQAYNQRAEKHFDGALLVLYPLWADFLAVPHQFNVGMYEEFKTWALEDQENGNDNGKKHLVKFYDRMLGSNNAMTERLSNDIVNLARSESSNNRLTWLKLRGAWRNGATNLKTRKRLADLLTVEEREELDKNN